MSARVGIVVFPGTNCELDVAYALEALGAEPELVWHQDRRLSGIDAVVVPGGFAHGDFLRTGAIARFSPVMDAVSELAAAGAPVVGICNGFQILTEAGLLPGVLRANASLSFVCRDVRVRVERDDLPFTSRAAVGDELTIPVKHGEGCWFADELLLGELEANGQIVLRYAAGENPNGAVADVAGVCNEAGNVLGLIPHPEHAVDPSLGSSDGAVLLGSLVDAARLSAAAFV